MDYPIHIRTISMGLPILYLKGSHVRVPTTWKKKSSMPGKVMEFEKKAE